ncbi:MAG: glycosyltransferase [Candidatus Omnitrophica bacterium]|nr:glycosyltransferase [Candidatus Omnitrophota bacterium]
MEKIKILRIIARLNIGGPAIHTVLLASGLDPLKFETTLVCGTPSKAEGDMGYYAASKSVKPLFLPELSREISIYHDFVCLLKLYRLIRKEKPQIIHTHTAKAGTIGRIAGIIFNISHRKNKIKLIHTFHGHIFKNYFGRFKTRIFIWIERILGHFSDKIITVSESIKNDLISLKIAEGGKIEVIPLGFELGHFLEIPARARQTEFNIGIIGRLTAIKNHRLFLQAAEKIIKKNISGITLNFKVVGDGELRKELENYAQALGIHKQTAFLGWQKDLPQIYNSLDAVVLTSLNEGTPVSLIEAMASNRTIIATNVGGVQDLLGEKKEIFPNFALLERGAMIKSNDATGLTDAVCFLISHPQICLAMAEQARIFAKNCFTKERLAKDIESLYARVLICTF